MISRIGKALQSGVAFVYVWVSKSCSCVYVGQTSGAGGTITRAGAHVSRYGTLRERFNDSFASDLEEHDDWVLLSFPLPKNGNYTSEASSFRLAVEYLVQVKLQSIRGKMSPRFRIISNVSYSDYCRLEEVKKLAEEIVSRFSDYYIYDI